MYKPLPSLYRFVLLQTHGYLASPMLKLKPLANDLSLSVLQSNGILSLSTSVTPAVLGINIYVDL